MDSKDIDRPYLAKLAGNLRGPYAHTITAFAADAIESLVRVIDGLQADAIRDPKIEDLEAEVSRLTAERARVCAALGIAETDAPVEAIEAWRADIAGYEGDERRMRALMTEDEEGELPDVVAAFVADWDALRAGEITAERDQAWRERDALRERVDALEQEAQTRESSYRLQEGAAANLAADLDALRAEVERSHKQIANITSINARDESWWAWMGDGSDDLQGMSDGMTISITARQMRAAIAEGQKVLRARAEGSEAVASELRAEVEAARERLDGAGVRAGANLPERVAIAIADRDLGWGDAEHVRARVAELEAEVKSLDNHRVEAAHAAVCAKLGAATSRIAELEARAVEAERERDELKRRIAAWEPCGTCRRERDEAKAEAGRLRRACENRSEAYRQQSELLDRHVAEKNRLCEAAGIMMLGNPAAGAAAIAEAIEAENDAEALAGPAFSALDSDDVEAAKKALAQMDGDARLRGTQAYARLSTMVSLDTTNVEGDSDAITAWRKLEEECRSALSCGGYQVAPGGDIAAAIRLMASNLSTIWGERDALRHAQVGMSERLKAASKQVQFFRNRLHAEIEVNAMRYAGGNADEPEDFDDETE